MRRRSGSGETAITRGPSGGLPGAKRSARSGNVFRRVARNAGWILGGRGFSGVVSLVYVAIAARTLGPHGFGVFSLILSYAGGFGALVSFQTSNAVIRYGSLHLAAGRADRLANLAGSLVMLDAATAIVGAAGVVLLAGVVGQWLGWTPSLRHAATLFSTMLLLSNGSTATGLLRLHGRFDLLALSEISGPLVRLAGSVVLLMARGDLYGFLIVWAAALVVEAAAGWIALVRLGATRVQFSVRAFAGLARDNRGLPAFLLHNNLIGSLSLVWQFGGVLTVGAFVGASAAGAVRLASKLTGALEKPVESVIRALYPELAHLTAGEDRGALRSVVTRMLVAASLLAAGVVVTVASLGGDILHLLYGSAYLYVRPLFLLLSIAAAIDLAVAPLKPLLNAHGASGHLLAAHALGAIVLLGLMALLVPRLGTIGVGYAAIGGMLAMSVATILSTMLVSRSAPRSSVGRLDRLSLSSRPAA